jgi:hypothetical protein
MRQLTEAGVPFSFEFYSYNSTTGKSSGHKIVPVAQLRQGYRNDQSHMAQVLIGYKNHSNGGVDRFFNMALLLKFNGYLIKP